MAKRESRIQRFQSVTEIKWVLPVAGKTLSKCNTEKRRQYKSTGKIAEGGTMHALTLLLPQLIHTTGRENYVGIHCYKFNF